MGATEYVEIRNFIDESSDENFSDGRKTSLICVSKTYDVEEILPVIKSGARNFGENRIQEAQIKWPALKEQYEDIELHLIGPLQSNKCQQAVSLFDAIHTIDREKIAAAISREMKVQNRKLQLFVQVNIGLEEQKTGISPGDCVGFVETCRQKHGLEVDGLMCIPPMGENSGPHFALLSKLAKASQCSKLSMGMSADYETAIEFGATHVRVGSAIFGQRVKK